MKTEKNSFYGAKNVTNKEARISRTMKKKSVKEMNTIDRNIKSKELF